MVNTKKALYDVMLADSSITAIVSDRIYHRVVPQMVKTFPLIVYLSVSSRLDAKNLRNETMQVSCWANTAEESGNLGSVVTSALHMMRDDVFQSCVIDSITESYDTESEKHGVHITIRVKAFDL